MLIQRCFLVTTIRACASRCSGIEGDIPATGFSQPSSEREYHFVDSYKEARLRGKQMRCFWRTLLLIRFESVSFYDFGHTSVAIACRCIALVSPQAAVCDKPDPLWDDPDRVAGFSGDDVSLRAFLVKFRVKDDSLAGHSEAQQSLTEKYRVGSSLESFCEFALVHMCMVGQRPHREAEVSYLLVEERGQEAAVAPEQTSAHGAGNGRSAHILTLLIDCRMESA